MVRSSASASAPAAMTLPSSNTPALLEPVPHRLPNGSPANGNVPAIGGCTAPDDSLSGAPAAGTGVPAWQGTASVSQAPSVLSMAMNIQRQYYATEQSRQYEGQTAISQGGAVNATQTGKTQNNHILPASIALPWQSLSNSLEGLGFVQPAFIPVLQPASGKLPLSETQPACPQGSPQQGSQNLQGLLQQLATRQPVPPVLRPISHHNAGLQFRQSTAPASAAMVGVQPRGTPSSEFEPPAQVLKNAALASSEPMTAPGRTLAELLEQAAASLPEASRPAFNEMNHSSVMNSEALGQTALPTNELGNERQQPHCYPETAEQSLQDWPELDPALNRASLGEIGQIAGPSTHASPPLPMTTSGADQEDLRSSTAGGGQAEALQQQDCKASFARAGSHDSAASSRGAPGRQNSGKRIGSTIVQPPERKSGRTPMPRKDFSLL